MKPRVLILTGYGINSEEETAKSFDWTGSESEIVHINDLIKGHKDLENYQILAFPGGFSYGDDTGSGNAIANKLRNNLQDKILKFAQNDKLIIGICNGFQMLVNLGLAPATNNQYGKREVALMHNAHARLECRWVYLKNTSKKCIWTRNIDNLHIPIAHSEGNFYAEEETIKSMQENDQIAFTYTKPDGSPANQQFPHNPNGAMLDIAGICDESGRIFGLMPHPERFNSFTNKEDWPLIKEQALRKAREKGKKPELPQKGTGLKIFENAANYFN